MKKEVFRAGTFTDSNGVKRTWTEADVKKIADQFDNEKGENSEGYKVPLFLAHPENEAEAPASPVNTSWLGLHPAATHPESPITLSRPQTA